MEKGAHASRTSLTGYGQALAINEGYFEPITDDRALADFVHGTLWSQEIVEQFGVANEDAKALPHAEEVQRKYVAFAETSHHNWVYTQGLATHLSLGVIYIKHKQFEKAEEIARRADAYFQKHREHLVDAEKDKIEAFRRDIQAARSREQLDRSNLDQRLLQVLLDRRINQNELSDDAKENLRALNTQLNTYAQRILAGGADAEKAMTEIVEETRQRRDYTANALIAETCTFVLDNNPALKKNLQRSLLEKIRVILHEMAEEYDKNNELYDSGRVIVGFLEMLKDKNHGVRNATASIKGAETLMLVRVFWRVREYGEQ
ncbi:hypothetical protein COU76_01060 [Candidatus Peregrinibacteria bacterium CG10_big_fil_rev_8_21_14_0_10_49_10]|nr:MAG: hypothetical protein COU76_01060 [Candidatus Peregrinibacteria bacterium CG10_big_fil_rev_8_21_14_0_10_49_10]